MILMSVYIPSHLFLFSVITQIEDGHYNVNVDILLQLLCTSKTSKICAETPICL